jgi:hypothetical protein
MSMEFLHFIYPTIYVDEEDETINIFIENIGIKFVFAPRRGKPEYVHHFSQIMNNSGKYSYWLNSYLRWMLLMWIHGWL